MESRCANRREVEWVPPRSKEPRILVLTYGHVPPDKAILHTDDITEQRRTERKLQISQRLEAVGRLAGGVAHDFNNMLSVIMGFTGFAIDSLREADPLRADLMEAQNAAERAAELTSQLLAFSSKQVLEPEVINPNEIVLRMQRMLRRLLGEDIELAVGIARSVGSIKADAGQIEQVIMNLAVNARDAMPQGGKLVIETANVALDEEAARGREGIEPGRYVKIAVSDTGCGMDAATKERVFEPFFTTKEMGKGTGLGLATAYGIVRQSGGAVIVRSEPGEGATFEIYLPRVDEPAAEKALKSLPAVATGEETVLIVEDEHAVRALAERMLRNAGYRVLVACDGGEALLLCEKHGGEIDLLLTDVVMPQMSGKELADRLAETRPEMKVLYMSGYTDEAIDHHGVLDAETHFIAKPFTVSELTHKVRNTLDPS
jgi:signal transduction histidine kinase/CheY-like chemotaxis protein